MNHSSKSLLRRALKDQSGQVLVWMSLLMILFLGMGGVTLDIGRAFFIYRELVASTDAAALAGGYAMSLSTATTTTVQAAVNSYSSYTGGANANPNLAVVSAPTVNYACLAALKNIVCASSPLDDNAIQVIQFASVPTLFIRALTLFGVKSAQSINLAAVSTASMRGVPASQYNVAMIIDTTSSMGNSDTDTSCNNTRIYCALQGVQTMLHYLTPCTASSTKTSCTPFDQVSLFTFPNVQANQAVDDNTCPTTNPAIPSYSSPAIGAKWTAPTGTAATYQITSYESDYSSTNLYEGTIKASSPLAIATGASTTKNCTGLQTPGGDGTYYAAAIYAAAASLVAEQQLNPGSLNALVILTDGAANTTKMSGIPTKLTTTGTYPSLTDQCQQGVAAAKYASSLPNTTVFVIAYGASSSTGQCTTDPTLTPCTALEEMATNDYDFYSDATAAQNKGQCISAKNPNLTLNQIFAAVAGTFQVAQLLPNSVF